MKVVRSAARALIIQNNRLLTIVMRRPRDEVFHILPGGGQLHGETLHETLLRECREEIGTEVEIGEIAYVREYIGRNHSFYRQHKEFHQLEVVFHCRLPQGVKVEGGPGSDKHQIGVEWIPLERLPEINFFPNFLKECVVDGKMEVKPLYRGDIN